MSLSASFGDGRLRMGRWSKPRWEVKQPALTRPIGEKKGVKRHLLTDGNGVPLSLVVTGANTNDSLRLAQLVDEIVVERPWPRKGQPQTLCADKGYDCKHCRAELAESGYRDGIKSRKDERREKIENPAYRARRWVVERTHSWFNRWRKLIIRYERKERNYFALLSIAAGVMALRAANVLG